MLNELELEDTEEFSKTFKFPSHRLKFENKINSVDDYIVEDNKNNY